MEFLTVFRYVFGSTSVLTLNAAERDELDPHHSGCIVLLGARHILDRDAELTSWKIGGAL